ncbi:hypothetical protein HUJ04_000889 [Dendroctonus ponderosae]|uniref:Uncharacterized protein n=2 Tax=Dendroctonus ponderosae TaxID=77166 RepID=A0AAR5Q8U1_DENPD|nr:hypothetical protein HUJ04_000889 [Dendroctonus ponderosae]
MEKKHATESIASVTIKPDYTPSEYCSEAPPAYLGPRNTSVQIAKIIASTVVVVAFIMGIVMLASAYVTATATCRQLEQDLELLGEVADRFENPNVGLPQPEALKQDETKQKKRQSESTEIPKKDIKEIDDNSVDDDSSDDSSEEPKVHFKLPLQLDFDDLAGSLIAKNQRSKMNCIVEKKRAEEVVDHQPKTLRLPFGVNLTTDPRFERLTGERMIIICESGNMQSAQQPEKPQQNDDDDDDDDDSEQDTIMIQPVMIPIPHTAFQTHMPQQMPPMQQQPQMEMRPMHPMESMRPPMPPMRPGMENMRPPMPQFRPAMDMMRPPMMPPMERRPMMEQPRQPIEKIIAIRQSYEPVSQSLEPQRSEEPQRPQMMFIPQQVQIRVEPQQSQQQSEASPNPIIQHIIQQIIAQKIAESQRASQESQQPQENRDSVEQQRPMPVRPLPQRVMPNGFPIPEEVLTQLNRLPNNDRVIVAVSEPESSEEDSSEESGETQEMGGQEQRPQPTAEMENRQAYVRRLPINMLANTMQQQGADQEEPQAAASEETRPHYVQPRSVSSDEPKSRATRSANPLLGEKRVKRCACDCAC